ncbi:hypothetical protein [Clostridium sp.]
MNIKDLITILQTYDENTLVVVNQDKHVGYEYDEEIEGIEETEYNGKLAIRII